jgi:hypothetical protein
MFFAGLSLAILVNLNNDLSDQAALSKAGSKIVLVIQHQDYNNGQLEIEGIAKNVGMGPVKKVEVKLSVYNQNLTTLLVENKTWPEGYKEKPMYPDDVGTFRFSVSVPGRPAFIDGQLSVEGTAFETKWPIESGVPK